MDLALLVKHESKSRVDKILWKAQSHNAINYNNTSDVVTALTSQTQPENANTVRIVISFQEETGTTN